MRCEFSSQVLGDVGVVGLLQVRCRRYDKSVEAGALVSYPPNSYVGYMVMFLILPGQLVSPSISL